MTTGAEILKASQAPAEAPAEAATPETQATTPEVAPEGGKPDLAALAAKETARVNEKTELSALREQIKELEAKLSSKSDLDPVEALRRKAQENPDAALELLGMDYLTLTNKRLGIQDNEEADKPVTRADLEKARKEWEAEQQKAQQKLLEEQNAKAIEAWRESVGNFVSTSESHPATKALDPTGSKVMEVIEAHALESGELMSTEQAADIVEKHFQGLISGLGGAQKAPETPAAPPKAPGLSNDLTGSTPGEKEPFVDPSLASDKEMRDALAAYERVLASQNS